jgi:NTE family protein
MEEELILALKVNKIFSSLDDPILHKIALKFHRVELRANEVLFYQGDPSDGIYLLVKGKLIAALTTSTGETKTVGHVDTGETIGEAGVLTGEPRALTIKTTSPCVIYRLYSKDFIEICHQYPTVMFATIPPLIARSNSLLNLFAEKDNKYIVIAPANKDISLEIFAEKLQLHIVNYPSITLFSDFDPELNNKNIPIEIIKEKIHTVEKNRKKSHKIIFLLKTCDTSLARIALKKATTIYVTAYSNTIPKIDFHLFAKFSMTGTHFRPDPNLILLHTASTVMPRNTAAWLSLAQFAMYHHLRMNVTKDYLRLLRFIRGKTTGVVLSGGGTRGWAHLGVIKALREERIPIDMIGGSSVGAIVAGCYAIHESYEDAYERFSKVIQESAQSVSWRNLTWPIISLFNAQGFTHSLIEVFNNTQIEDLWLPYFCVTCNLATNNEETHYRGLLWEKTRASSSIPGIIPPVLINNELHLDGGLLNNLPVDIMRAFLGNKSKIIASELNSFTRDAHKYQFPPILTFKQSLLAKMGFTHETFRFPRFVDTFLRALFIGSLAKSRQNGLSANMLISLDLNKFRLLHSNPKQAEKLIQIGYESTIKQIRLLKSEDK